MRVAMAEREFHSSCALGIGVVLVLWEKRRCERRGEVTGRFPRGGGPWALVSLWLRGSLRELECVNGTVRERVEKGGHTEAGKEISGGIEYDSMIGI